ncbi:MAG TPA: terpene synthase family protein [bacterium]|nr:terpene synthase family protein [bacterium]
MGLSAGLARTPSKTIPKQLKKRGVLSEVVLTYPRAWKVNSHLLAKEMEQDTYRWLCGLGVIQSPEETERFRKLTVDGYGGWPFPYADSERVKYIMRFLALWIFYDDIIEEKDDGLQAQLREAIAGRPEVFPGGSPHFRGWWELGQIYRRDMSPQWMERHAERYTEWVWSTRSEADQVRQYRESGRFHSAAQQLSCRTIAVGMLPTIDFVEYALGWELPEALLQDPDMKRLESTTCELMAIINDVFGFSKDRKNRWCNLVPCLAEEFHVPNEEAFHWAVSMHNARIREIELLEQKILGRFGPSEELNRWFKGFHALIYGLARWQGMATRYRNLHEVEDGHRMRVRIAEID